MDGERSFGNEFDSNVVTFGVTSSLSSHTDDRKKKLWRARQIFLY